MLKILNPIRNKVVDSGSKDLCSSNIKKACTITRDVPKRGSAKSGKQLSTLPYTPTHASCPNDSCIRTLRDERMANDDERVMRNAMIVSDESSLSHDSHDKVNCPVTISKIDWSTNDMIHPDWPWTNTDYRTVEFERNVLVKRIGDRDEMNMTHECASLLVRSRWIDE